MENVLRPAGVAASDPEFRHAIRDPERSRADTAIVGDATGLFEHLKNWGKVFNCFDAFSTHLTCSPALGPSCAESQIPMSHCDPLTFVKTAWSTEW